MKFHVKCLPGVLLFLCLYLVGCSASREQEVEGDLNEFRSWVNSQASNIADRTEEDWNRTKEDFKLRTQELDQKQESFTDDAKEEYKQLKVRFDDLENERARKLEQRDMLEEWQKELLGSYADMSTITAGNIREVYVTFMENVRSRQQEWSSHDWNMADMVFEELGKRKDEVDDNLSSEDEVKIRALQMEYKTLETTGNTDG